MPLSPLSALSPLDGRYASKTDALRPILSEAGFMHHRVKVEIAWLLALSEAGFAEIKPFSAGAAALLNKLAADFTEADLSEANFSDTNLTRATFDHTVLERADLRTANAFSIDPQRNKLTGARLTLSGLPGLLDAHQLRIEP